MAFEWNRVHKHEEQVENDIYDRVSEQVCSFYNVEDVAELNEDQIAEIKKWANESLHSSSIMQQGFFDIFNYWDDNQWQSMDLEAGNDNELQ